MDIHKDTYYKHSYKDHILFKVYGMTSPHLCDLFGNWAHPSVYGIVLLQAAADGITAYNADALGWSLPNSIVYIGPDTVDVITANLLPAIDALSKLESQFTHIFQHSF
jgi:hypothetical protein